MTKSQAESGGWSRPALSHSQTTQTLVNRINWKVLEHIRKKASSAARDDVEKGRVTARARPPPPPKGGSLARGTSKSPELTHPKVSKGSSWKERLVCWGLLVHLCGPRAEGSNAAGERQPAALQFLFSAS